MYTIYTLRMNATQRFFVVVVIQYSLYPTAVEYNELFGACNIECLLFPYTNIANLSIVAKSFVEHSFANTYIQQFSIDNSIVANFNMEFPLLHVKVHKRWISGSNRKVRPAKLPRGKSKCVRVEGIPYVYIVHYMAVNAHIDCRVRGVCDCCANTGEHDWASTFPLKSSCYRQSVCE